MQQPSTQPVSNENRLLAALGYPFGIIAIIVLLTDMKNNRFMKYHAVQALLLILAAIVVFGGASIIIGILTQISLAFAFFGFLIPLVWLGWIVLTIYYAVQAYNGKVFSIPVIGTYATRFAPAP
ncbi:MAG TPA: DUF4870 domain-containing protein [bacterium]|jgi:uncharacterized membrane protein|nr:DUF4870 domain-containing protein [bacterium]